MTVANRDDISFVTRDKTSGATLYEWQLSANATKTSNTKEKYKKWNNKKALL